jgi:predicted ATPase
VIATHSPILLAYLHAQTDEFRERGVQQIASTGTQPFRVTHDFLVRTSGHWKSC